MENSQPNKESNLAWHFWFLVLFSLFLMVTFVYYLPLRFLHSASSGDEHMMEDME